MHDGDEFADDDSWVFCDLWRHAGIRYPDDVDSPDLTLDLGADWDAELPDNPTRV